jgi:hypothetical protein
MLCSGLIEHLCPSFPSGNAGGHGQDRLGPAAGEQFAGNLSAAGLETLGLTGFVHFMNVAFKSMAWATPLSTARGDLPD